MESSPNQLTFDITDEWAGMRMLVRSGCCSVLEVTDVKKLDRGSQRCPTMSDTDAEPCSRLTGKR